MPLFENRAQRSFFWTQGEDAGTVLPDFGYRSKVLTNGSFAFLPERVVNFWFEKDLQPATGNIIVEARDGFEKAPFTETSARER